MGFKKLGRDLYLLGGSPATLVVLGDEPWIIDPGMGGERCRSIRGFLGVRGVEHYGVFATHAHPDHINAAWCMEKPLHIHGAEACAAREGLIRDVVVYGARAPRGLFHLEARDAGQVEPVEWGFRLGPCKAVALPGHSPGHTGILCEEQGVLHAADAVFGDRLLGRAGAPFFSDYIGARSSVERVGEYVEAGYRISMGHGPVVRGERAEALVRANIGAMDRALRLILELLGRPRGVSELTYMLAERLGASLDVEGLLLNEVPVKAVLSYLVDEGRVEPRTSGAGVVWARRP
ncbi:MAG: MBL fold metallo-hydrolase [Candidatus Korarchaeota archaeon]|nr:MBL fold metallo-hydrolase [Candidatus Korarchaeota archaeon]